MTPKPGQAVRGSSTGRPIMVLFDALGQKWSMRILWELRDGPHTFRDLRERCDEVSPTLLNSRLKMLKDLGLTHSTDNGYALTAWGADLGKQLAQLDVWANKWAEEVL